MVTKVTEPPIEISGRVITIDAIKKLANVIENEYSESMTKSKPSEKQARASKSSFPEVVHVLLPPTKKYILKSADKTQYEDDDSHIFAEKGRLYDKRIVAIEMDFSDRENDKNISVKLEHGNVSSDISNVITVSGKDEIWANGVHRTLENLIKDCKEQPKFTPFRRAVLLLTLSPIFAALFTETIIILSKLAVSGAVWDISAWSFLFFWIFIIGLWFVTPLVKRIEKLYPSVELVTGPEHMRIEESGRKKLWTLIAYYVIPFVFLVISEIINLLLR